MALWDVAKGKKLGVLPRDKAEVHSEAFSPDEKWVATAGNSATAKLWDLETKEWMRSYKGQLLGLMAVSISPDTQRLVAGTGEGTLKLWDLLTGQEVSTLKGHCYTAHYASFLDSDTLISGSVDDVIVWKSASFAEIEAAEKGPIEWPLSEAPKDTNPERQIFSPTEIQTMSPNCEELLFQLALTKPGAGRAAWLNRECGEDKAWFSLGHQPCGRQRPTSGCESQDSLGWEMSKHVPGEEVRNRTLRTLCPVLTTS